MMYDNSTRTYGRTTVSNGERSLGSLVRELRDETTHLLRAEVELAKTELSEKVARVGRNVAYLAAGGMIAYVGLLAIVAAACIGAIVLLDMAMDIEVALWLGPLLVGLAIAIVGYAFVQKAISTLRRESLIPPQTTQTMKENKQWIQERLS